MRIFESIRNHFAALLDQPIPTLARKRPFWIRKGFEEDTASWVLILEVGQKGGKQYIYLTDLINVYFWMLRNRWREWTTLKDIHGFIGIGKAQDTYIMALLATFDDIEAKPDGSAIRFMPPKA
jgi:hypothetical protein